MTRTRIGLFAFVLLSGIFVGGKAAEPPAAEIAFKTGM